jgi:hypothetical protein
MLQAKKNKGDLRNMTDATQIKEHSEVVGSDGQHVGTVDHVEGDRIKLARRDPNAGGEHHYISLDLVESTEGNRVQLNISAQEAQSQWQSEGGQSNSASM